MNAERQTLGSSGAFLVTYPRDKIRTVVLIGWFVDVTFIPAALLMGVWFIVQLLSIGVVADVQSGGVAYLAHVGGMIFGAVTARLFEDPGRLKSTTNDDGLK